MPRWRRSSAAAYILSERGFDAYVLRGGVVATDLADTLLYHVKQHGKHNIAYYQGQEIRLIRDPGTNPVT